MLGFALYTTVAPEKMGAGIPFSKYLHCRPAIARDGKPMAQGRSSGYDGAKKVERIRWYHLFAREPTVEYLIE